MIKRLFRWMSRYLMKGEARYYITEFLTSSNGMILSKEVQETELRKRTEYVQELLMSEWLPNQKDLYKKVDFTIKYYDQLQTNQTLSLLFDEPLRLPFDWYQVREVEDLIHVQVMTALALSDQLHEKDSNLFIIIIEHDRAVFNTMSAIRYQVCRVFDWGTRFHERETQPPGHMILEPDCV